MSTEYPNRLRYTKDHEWADLVESGVRVGITPYAVKQLGDVTLVDLCEEGTTLSTGDRFGDIESVKTVSELFSPVQGVVQARNLALETTPEHVNDAPFEAGWMVVIAPTDAKEFEALMSAEEYQAYVAGLD